MATRRKAKPKKLKFELTGSAIGGIGIVTFCLFLWMFLLGVWTGQSLLRPAPTASKQMQNAVASEEVPVIRPRQKAVKYKQ